jgi:hypothetical protein
VRGAGPADEAAMAGTSSGSWSSLSAFRGGCGAVAGVEPRSPAYMRSLYPRT